MSKVFQPSIRSPQVGSDGSVIFQVAAPSARQVQIDLDALAAPLPLHRDADGLWRGSSPALAPDLYCYRVVIDGVPQPDVANPWVKPASAGPAESLVLLPGQADGTAPPWQRGAAPRGLVARHNYRSAALGTDRDFYVYTPPGYDRRADRTYPVLYLLHGLGDDAGGWLQAGRAGVMLDTLIARGRCAPMLLVCPSGHCHPDLASDLPAPPAGVARRNIELMGETLLGEVMPIVEQGYAVHAGRASSAVAGLSMGGVQALFIGLNHPHAFAHVGAFSPAVFMLEHDYAACLRQAPQQAPAPALAISCGRDDFLFDEVCSFVDWLRQDNTPHAWQVVEGGHTWIVWRRNFIDFVKTLFKEDHHDVTLSSHAA